MRLADSIQSVLILDDTGATNRDQAIEAILGQMSAAGLFSPSLAAELQASVIRRDELGPTGIGEGVAIPHIWHAGLDRMAAALAVSRGGLEYPSLDGEPVHIIVMILTPQGAASEPAKQGLFEAWLHHLRDPAFRAELRLGTTAAELWETIRAEDRVAN
jgi:mannitol/fructose-specific phosphotransferase system IIA component (Ntr-type)